LSFLKSFVEDFENLLRLRFGIVNVFWTWKFRVLEEALSSADLGGLYGLKFYISADGLKVLCEELAEF